VTFPIYICERQILNPVNGAVSYRLECASFRPIPESRRPGQSETTVWTLGADAPALWVRCPPGTRLVAPKGKVRHEFPEVLQLLSDVITAKCAWVVLGAMRGGRDRRFKLSGPPAEVAALPPAELLPPPPPPADRNSYLGVPRAVVKPDGQVVEDKPGQTLFDWA
jgi:hypothetical protein